jgi:hypothetical protein
VRRLAVALAVTLALAGGCTLFESDIPDKSCRSDQDCFRAQGERCDTAIMECVTTAIDAPPGAADAAMPDAAAAATATAEEP